MAKWRWPILGICALHLTHPSAHTHTHTPWTHTRNSGQLFMLQRPGSSWGFGALLKGLTSVMVLRVERALYIHSPHLQSLPGLRLEPVKCENQLRIEQIVVTGSEKDRNHVFVVSAYNTRLLHLANGCRIKKKKWNAHCKNYRNSDTLNFWDGQHTHSVLTYRHLFSHPTERNFRKTPLSNMHQFLFIPFLPLTHPSLHSAHSE